MRNIIVALIFSVAVVAIITIGYFFFKNQQFQFKNEIAAIDQSKDETVNWKTYDTGNASFKYPFDWDLDPWKISENSFIQKIKDPSGVFVFNFTQQANYNNETAKPFSDLYEFINMPRNYYKPGMTIDGKEAIQFLPRAGSENINSVAFFSKDLVTVYIFELATQTKNEAKIQEGQKVFSQILSTFKFLDQNIGYRDAQRRVGLSLLQNAIELYRADDNISYPQTKGEPSKVLLMLIPKYLVDIPEDPSGRLFYYEYTPENDGYFLCASMENYLSDYFSPTICKNKNCGEVCNYEIRSWGLKQ